ncbi:NEAT domain-containing protein [Cytobacillus kochii]|uniref:NEAT domain-containing protein n=1 Tax=Cytobacillus kochii TaxID=859143 RepID=UPI0025A0B850|nr:NEAT domain-containing protein [Cytobacillus kochii]MDM5206898.1 NEAT domain-containing protein [Cytobacillus kochii]
MKRILRVTVALFVLALAVLQNASPIKVNAAQDLANGKYTINYQILYNGQPNASWNSFFENPASLTAKDGALSITIKINGANQVMQKIQTESNGTYQDAQVVSEDQASRVYQFPVDGLDQSTNVKLFMSYGTHTIQLSFDENSITTVELDQPDEPKPEEPGTEEPGTEEPGTEEPGTEEPGTEEPGTEEPGTEEPGTEEPGTEEPGTEEPGTEEPGTEEPGTEEPGTEEPGTEEPGNEELADGQYTINYQVLYDGQPAPANWAGFFQSPATLTIANGVPYISFNLGASHVITNLQSELNDVFEDVEVVSENAAEQTKLVKFQIADVNQLTNLRMVMSYGSTHDVALEYDVDSIQPIGNENPGTEEPGGENPGTEEPGTEEPGDNEPAPNDDVLVDGEYPLLLSILGVDSDTESAFAKYFADEALLTVNDGEYSLQFTQVTGLDTLGTIEFDIAGETVALEEISRDEEAGERVLSVNIEAIQETYVAAIEAIGAPHLYPVRFVLDVSSLDVEIDDDGNGQTPPPITPGEDKGSGSGNNNDSHLPFDRNDNQEQPKDNQKNVTNVKTGDSLNYLQVGIYAALLLLSGFYLFRKYRLKGMGM